MKYNNKSDSSRTRRAKENHLNQLQCQLSGAIIQVTEINKKTKIRRSLWLKTKVIKFDFNHMNDNILILFAILCESNAFWWKTRLFCSFQISHTQASQIILRNGWEDLSNPAWWPNWRKWSRPAPGAIKEIPSHCKIACHTLPKVVCSLQDPQPPRHTLSSFWRICLRTKLSLVGSRLQISRQENSETFSGVCLCQTSSNIPPVRMCIYRREKMISPFDRVTLNRIK